MKFLGKEIIICVNEVCFDERIYIYIYIYIFENGRIYMRGGFICVSD